MYYTIYAKDYPGTLEKRLNARPAHVERLKALVDAGRLLVAGPNPAIDTENPGPAGFTGSLIVARFDSLSDARSWADGDPYIAAGVYESVEVKPYRKVPALNHCLMAPGPGQRLPRSGWPVRCPRSILYKPVYRPAVFPDDRTRLQNPGEPGTLSGLIPDNTAGLITQQFQPFLMCLQFIGIRRDNRQFPVVVPVQPG